MENQLQAMRQVVGGQVHLLSNSYGDGWICFAEGKVDGTAFKVEGKGDLPGEAVDQAFTRWCKIVQQVPEFLPQLAPPPVDDEIPF